MKITGLRVDGYGVLNGLEIDGLGEGLHVFYGPNEAGKTTLMQFVRSMLYGFSAERRRYLPPVHGGRPGGGLALLSPEGRLELSRHDNLEEPARGDLVSVMYPDGTRQNEHALQTILSGIDENLFNHVFCVGLQELQELGTLSDTEASRMLFHLSTGLGSISLADVVDTLADARNQVLDLEGRPCEVSRLLEQRNRLRAEVEEIGRVTRDYGRLAAEQSRADREIDRLEKEADRLRHELRITEIAAAVQGRWQDRVSADRQLAAVGPTDSIPHGAIHKLESIDAKLDHRREYLTAWKKRWAKLRREAADLQLNDTLERIEPRIEALREQEPWLKTLEERKLELELEISELESRMSVERRQFGLDDSATGMPTLSPSTVQVLRQPARAMKQAKAEVEQAQRALAESEEKAIALFEQVESRLAGSGVDDLSLALQRQGDLVAKLRRRVKIDEQLEQMQGHRKELEEQGHRLVENQLMPIWATAGVGAALAAGAVLLLALCLFSSGGFATWGWPLALFIVGGVIGARVARRVWERTAERRLKDCRRQVTMLMSQIEEKRREAEKLDRDLPKSDAPSRERLTDAEAQMAELEGFVSRDAQRLTAQDEAETAANRVEEAQRAQETAKRRWKAALASVGLPEDISPGQIRSLMTRNEEIVDVSRRLEHRREELQQRDRELAGLKRRISDLVSEAMITVAAPSDPIEGLRLLSAAVSEQRAKQKRLGELRAQARKLRRKRKRLDRSVRQLKAARRRLFRAAGTIDEAEFRRRAAHFAEIEALNEGRGSIQREIEAAIGGYCEESVIADVLEGRTGESLSTRAEELRRDLGVAEKRMQERYEQRGRLAEQLRVLSDNRAPAAKQLEMNLVEQQLAEALHRWRVRAVARHTLDEIRQNYQRDRQPETLREASDYLERLTQGRYTRVWTPLDEDVLVVDDQHGEPRSVDVLSRGTREQLFICLRLALAAGFARRGVVLPLVLDDVLVNFDVDRAKAAAEVMRDFAATGHQVLVFTCHEHIQKIFKTLKVPVDTLPSHSETKLLATKPAKPKRTKPPAPKPEPVPEPVAEEPVTEEEPIEEEPVAVEEPVEVIELGEEDQVVSFQFEEDTAEDDHEEEDETVWEEIVDEDADDEEEPGDEDPDDLWEEEDEYDDEEYDEAGEIAEETDDEPENDSDGSRLRRRMSDDWDDRYEDEYDEFVEEEDAEEGADIEAEADDEEYEYEYEEYDEEDEDEAEAA